MRLCLLDGKLDPQTRRFYRRAIDILHESELRFLIGGAYAFGCYTGIQRATKDLDVFVHPQDANQVLDVLAHAGYKTELTDEGWLGKTFHAEDLVDVIFGSANGIAMVDDEWFDYSCEAMLLGLKIKLIPPEEMIWSKSFVMTRDRYDGADILHIIRCLADELNWDRMIRRFGPNWRILYNYIILFGYVYPSERTMIPKHVMEELKKRLEEEMSTPVPDERICRGTLLSTTQYAIDLDEWGYTDPRNRSTNTFERE